MTVQDKTKTNRCKQIDRTLFLHYKWFLNNIWNLSSNTVHVLGIYDLILYRVISYIFTILYFKTKQNKNYKTYKFAKFTFLNHDITIVKIISLVYDQL